MDEEHRAQAIDKVATALYSRGIYHLSEEEWAKIVEIFEKLKKENKKGVSL